MKLPRCGPNSVRFAERRARIEDACTVPFVAFAVLSRKHRNDPAVELYRKLLQAWNDRDAAAYARLFSDDGSIVGFDGSTADGKDEIKAHLEPIFAHHPTAAYVGKVRAVRKLATGSVLVRAVAGMVPPGKRSLMPERNAVQSLVASRQPNGDWKIEMFQNTPARFDGRPNEVEKLTRELEIELEGAQ